MNDRKPLRENAQSTAEDLHSDNTAENDRIHAATSGQGEVKPEDYPLETREERVKAAIGRDKLNGKPL